MCLTVFKQSDKATYSRDESKAACENMTCDGLRVRLPIANSEDKLRDIHNTVKDNFGTRQGK
jgi:hypothetical protein